MPEESDWDYGRREMERELQMLRDMDEQKEFERQIEREREKERKFERELEIGLDRIEREPRNNRAVLHPKPRLSTTPKLKFLEVANAISSLFYAGIIMTLAVQFARANAWSLPLFKSYENAFAASLFLVACGIARTAQVWQNYWASLGIFVTAIGGLAWKYQWILPIVKINGLPVLVIGICILLYGIVPQLLGVILIIPGTLLLSVELWLMFTKGLAAIHSGNLLIAIILISLSALMFSRQKKLRKKGVFRARR